MMETPLNHAQSDDEDQSTKRSRSSNSCAVCRRRKVKCDKLRPACTQCVKRETSSECTYEEHPWTKADAENLNRAADVLQRALAGLQRIEDSFDAQRSTHPNTYQQVALHDYVPFHTATMLKKGRVEYAGAMSLMYTFQHDKHFKVVWMAMWKSFEKAMTAGFKETTGNNTTTTPISTGTLNVSPFTKEMAHVLAQVLGLKRQKTALKAQAKIILGATRGLDDYILAYLPPRRTIRVLCDRFIELVYPLFPILDVELLMGGQVPEVLGSWDSTDPIVINSSSSYAYATIALVFLMMVTASMTLQDGDYDNDDDLRDWKGRSLSVFHVVARRCLDEYNFLRKNHCLTLLQALIYLKVYYMHCPEDDDASDSSSSRALIGTVFSMATSVGLNAEADDLIATSDSVEYRRFGALRRQIWHTIMDLDATTSVLLGVAPLCQSDDMYDIDLPRLSPNMTDVEKVIHESFQFGHKKSVLYRQVAVTCFMRNSNPTVQQLFNIIYQLETFVQNSIGSLEDIISKYPSTSAPLVHLKIKKVIALTDTAALCLAFKIRLLAHFRKTGDHAMTLTLLDQVSTLVMKSVSSLLNMIFNLHRYFTPALTIFLRAMGVNNLHHCSTVICSLLATVAQAKKLSSDASENRREIINRFHNVLISQLDKIVQIMRLINDGYYNYERQVLGLGYFLHLLKDDKYDFDVALNDVLEKESDQDGSTLRVQRDEIPETNLVMDMLDEEIVHITATLTLDVIQILKPLDTSPESMSKGPLTKPPRVPSIYDPVRDLSASSTAPSIFSPSSTALTPLTGSPNSVDLEDLFGEKNFGFGKSAFGAKLNQDTNEQAINEMTMTGEEFAELIGLFTDEFNEEYLQRDTILPDCFTDFEMIYLQEP